MLRIIVPALVAFVALGLLTLHHGPLGIDRAAFDALDSIVTPTGRHVVRVLTEIGSYPAIVLVGAAGATIAARQGRTDTAIALAIGVLLVILTVTVTKQIWDRPRPVGRFYDPQGHSFPSGHSAYAITWIAAAAAIGGRRLILSAMLVAVTIGVCRLYLHVHYLTDVLGGYALGAAVFAPVLARTRP